MVKSWLGFSPMWARMAVLKPSFATCVAVGFLSALFFLARSSSSWSINAITASQLSALCGQASRRMVKQSRLVSLLVLVIVSIPFWFVRFSVLFMYLLYHKPCGLSIPNLTFSEKIFFGKSWLVYPAYPRHYFSLRGLVHIYIPHTGIPCGRIIGNRSYWLSWALPNSGLPFPHLMYLLYHRLSDLSILNFEFLKILFEVLLCALPQYSYSITDKP